MQNQMPNRTDQAVNDFFHSKTWKTLWKIWLTMFLLAASAVCCVFVLSSLGILTSILTFFGIASDVVVPEIQASQETPMVFLPLPTDTSIPPVETVVVDWNWVELPLHNTRVYLPDNWDVVTINEKTIPWDNGTKQCGDYLLLGPNSEVITLAMPCEFGEGVGGPCSEDIQVIMEIKDSNFLYRIPDIENNRYIYGSAYYGQWTWMEPSGFGYWCISNYPETYIFEVTDKSVLEITDFTDINTIMLSLFLNE